MPPSSDVVHLPDHKVARSTSENSAIAEKVKALSGGPVEFMGLDAGDNVGVDAWLLKPPNFDPSKKYPLIVLVYSEPASQTVVDRWTAGFDRALTSAGYLVASFDNSGTPAPRGRDWRKIVYGNIGPLSSKQQATALQAMEKTHPYIDAKRVGVWGWSGGGTETLNLMFRYPDVYSVGVSVASVPDQRLYDTIYQERYLGLPQDTPKAYEESSAINFASGLRGNLLVMHGSGDDNVHFQGFELLVNKLISLGKQFDMRVYPARTHGIFEGRGTSVDVYTNILGYFMEHLPPVAVPATVALKRRGFLRKLIVSRGFAAYDSREAINFSGNNSTQNSARRLIRGPTFSYCRADVDRRDDAHRIYFAGECPAVEAG